jgi:hypothetical protein
MPEPRRPITAPPPAMPTHTPTAFARSSSGNEVVMTDSVVGMTNAAPTPMNARRTISVDGSFTNIAASAAPPNTASPINRIPLRP